MGCGISVERDLNHKTKIIKEDNLDYVFNILYEGKYVTNDIEMRALSCVNKYLRTIYSNEETDLSLKWFISVSLNQSLIFEKCVLFGEKDVLEWMENRGYSYEWNDWNVEICIRRNHVDLLNWIYEKKYIKTIWDEYRYVRLAAKYGSEDILEWAYKKKLLQNEHWDEWVVRTTVINGRLNVLEWAYNNNLSNNVPWNEWILRELLNNGHLHILEWAYNNQSMNTRVWNQWMTRIVVAKGYIGILRWADSKGYIFNTWNEWITRIAIKSNRLNILIFAHEKGYNLEWNEWITKIVESTHNTNIIQWAKLNGYMNQNVDDVRLL